jgi:hypothetical protein
MSDEHGHYYEIGTGRILDWGFSDAYGIGWVKFITDDGRIEKMNVHSILEISDHLMTYGARWGLTTH